MRIYELQYLCEDTPNGFAYEYFTNRGAAERRVRELKTEWDAEMKKARERYGNELDGFKLPRCPPDTIAIEVLNIHGTTREMVLWALKRHT